MDVSLYLYYFVILYQKIVLVSHSGLDFHRRYDTINRRLYRNLPYLYCINQSDWETNKQQFNQLELALRRMGHILDGASMNLARQMRTQQHPSTFMAQPVAQQTQPQDPWNNTDPWRNSSLPSVGS